MDKIEEEISQQPAAMKSLLKYYLHGDGRGLLEKIAVDSKPLFTGMGASYHAAAIAAMQCQQAGIPAAAFETTDLLTPVPALLNTYSPLIYISQSGESAEVPYFLRRIEQGPLLGVTNDEQSTLALSATTVLPLHAGEETLIASKTYLNTLSLIVVGRPRISNTWDGTEEDRVNRVAKRVNLLLTGRNSLLTAWHDVMENAQHLVFTGRGTSGDRCQAGCHGHGRVGQETRAVHFPGRIPTWLYRAFKNPGWAWSFLPTPLPGWIQNLIWRTSWTNTG